MIKIYFDWNVLSQMKNGNHPYIKEIIQNNDKYLIPFSTSHINDITSNIDDSSRQQQLINTDLEFISKITKEYCLFNNGKGIVLDIFPPRELYNQNLDSKDQFKDFSIEGLLRNFEEDDEIKGLVEPLFNSLMSIPLEESFKQAFDNPESAQIMEQMFPGLKENPTMEGFFQSFNNINRELNHEEGYKQLRKTVQSGMGINRDQIFNTQNPFEYIKTFYDKLGVTSNFAKLDSSYAPKWFNDITEQYLQLDLHGYQEDKVSVKRNRKETFRNTTDDAFHAAFASTCNIYVINDKRAYKKTKQVYENLNINTWVFLPQEFLDFHGKYLKNDNPILDLKLMQHIMESENFYDYENENGVYRTFYFPYFLFGFFNKMICYYSNEDAKENSTFLSQDKPTNWFLLTKEVELLVKRLLGYFGSDTNLEGELKQNEFDSEDWSGRRWNFETLTLRLICKNGFVQLYWDN